MNCSRLSVPVAVRAAVNIDKRLSEESTGARTSSSAARD
jgi:hypothetical protein